MDSFRATVRCDPSLLWVPAAAFLVCQYPLTLKAEWQLASKAGPQAAIVVPKDGGRPLRFAARELQKYVRQMTDAELPILSNGDPVSGHRVTLLSASQADPQVPARVRGLVPANDALDAFRLKTLNDQLVIAGSSDRAVLYGVYALLEQWGCRWMGPGEDEVPHLKTLVLNDMDLHDRAAFRWRGLELIAGSSPSVIDWMGKARLNVAWPEQYVPEADLSVSEPAMIAAGVPQMLDRGMTIFWGGHILPQLMPVDKYKLHPKYFALIKGKRLNPEEDIHNRNQLCISNPETLRILTDNTIQFLRTHPWVDVLFIWAGDTTQWCECDKCLALLPEPNRTAPFGGLDRSVLYTTMIKVVSAGVHRALPERRIAFNHYYNLENLPTDKRGKVMDETLPPRFVLSAVDDYHQCDRHSFADATCPHGKRIESIARMWNRYYPESVSWSYYFAWNFTLGLPISEVHKIPADFRFLRGLGVRGMVDNVSLEPKTLHWVNNLRNFYIYGKAAWNPDLDVNAVMNDFDLHFYGPAAEPMIKAWSLIDEATRKYGQMPGFMPENATYAKPQAIHGRMRDIESLPGNVNGVNLEHQVEYLIPNREIYSRLASFTRDALARAEGARSPHAPYVERVLMLKAVVDAWDKKSLRWEPFGFLNGGGYLKNLIYTLDRTIHCSVLSGNNMGDCFWSKPAGTRQLVNVGDSVQIKVGVNVGADIVGSPLYRGGPGLYQSADPTTAVGTAENHSAVLFIGNRDNNPNGRQVALCVNDGKYESSFKSSADRAWDYRQSINLRVKYAAADNSRHVYRYGFDAGRGWIDLGEATFTVKLPFVGPSFHFSVYEPAKVTYPITNWATAGEMVLRHGNVD